MNSLLEDKIEEIGRMSPQTFQDTHDGDAEAFSKSARQHKMWLNPAQKLIHDFGARIMYIAGGRGLGKTTVTSLRWRDCVSTIPRGSGVWMAASLKQGYTKTLPNLVMALEQQGLREGIDFKRGRPDKKMKWEMPLATPRTWENALIAPNGNIMFLTSSLVASAANGMNLAYSISDEYRFVNQAVMKESVLPAIRGTIFPGGHPGWSKSRNPFYLSQFYVSDVGITIKEQEWEQEEEYQTDDINDQICDLLAKVKYCEIYDKTHHTNTAWQLTHSPKFIEKMQFLRTKSKVFMRFGSGHNLSFLGLDYLHARKRDMPPLLYSAQILGQRIKRDASTAFYANFDAAIHTYRPSEKDEVEAIYNKYTAKQKYIVDIGGMTKTFEDENPDLQELSKLSNNSVLDVDIDATAPLVIAHDPNNNVNTLVIAQEQRHNGRSEARFLRSMFVVAPRMLEDLMDDFCHYYAHHLKKTVVFYYDTNSKQGSYGTREAEQYRFYKVIERCLRNHGWEVIMVDLGNPLPHDVKYEFTNGALSGRERLFPMINALNNDYLIASLEAAKISTKFGRKHKDKSNEKKTSGTGMSISNDDGDTLGTNNYSDMSDAFDTALYGMIKRPLGKGTNRWGGRPLRTTNTHHTSTFRIL